MSIKGPAAAISNHFHSSPTASQIKKICWPKMSSSAMVLLALAVCAAVAFAGPAFPGGPPLLAVARPYEYGYDFNNGLGMSQQRHEVSDGAGNVKGGYGYLDPSGLFRRVEYTAGAEGYRAVVRSNEPGSVSHSAGDALYYVDLPPPSVVAQGLRAALPTLSSV